MAIEKLAETRYPIHDLLKRRWSPRAFSDRHVEPEKLFSLFEAARWAPSCNNEQPWHFLVADKKDQKEFQRILDCLAEGNRVWAQHAPVLLISVARMKFTDSEDSNRHALHDVGLAVANLVMQATALDLAVHQMAGFDVERARQNFSIPAGFEPVTAIALGYPGDPDSLPERLRSRELAKRSRKPLTDFLYSGQWGQSFQGPK